MLRKYDQVIWLQLKSLTLSTMILVVNSSALSQITQQVSIWHVLHDHYWVNCKETIQISEYSIVAIVCYMKKKKQKKTKYRVEKGNE